MEFLLYLQYNINIIAHSDDVRFIKGMLLKYIPCVSFKFEADSAFMHYNSFCIIENSLVKSIKVNFSFI